MSHDSDRERNQEIVEDVMVVASGVVACLRSIVNGCTAQESEFQYFLLGLVVHWGFFFLWAMKQWSDYP